MSEEQDTTEEIVEEQVEETTNARDLELESLKDQIAQLSHSQSQLVAALNQPKVEKKGIDQAQLAAMAKDPAAIAAWLQEQTTQAKNEIKRESQKEIYDKKAYDDFPVLKTDKMFQSEVQKQMKEFVQTSEYKPDDPMLIYRAAQIVAGKMKSVDGKKSTNHMTSEAPGVRSKSVTSQSTSKIGDTDPRVVFAKALGIAGKKLDEFKTTLGPYIPTARPRGRTLRK